MGGLICRSMIQKVCPDNGIAAGDLVDKFFTYATPHNGIDFGILGLNIPVPQIAPFDAQIFNRKVMYQYLTPAAELRRPPACRTAGTPTRSPGLDPSRVFCLIGTNAADYGMVSQAVGPKSDGLVQIDNAYVRGASRTFVHRSHSGRYGEVNSEEGYQNLRRFLFGTRKATARLAQRDPAPVDVPQTCSTSGRPRSASASAGCRCCSTTRRPPTTARSSSARWPAPACRAAPRRPPTTC